MRHDTIIIISCFSIEAVVNGSLIFFVDSVVINGKYNTQNSEFSMELKNSDEALFNSSTEFLISFDSADNTNVSKPDQRHEDSSAVKVSGDERTLLTDGQAVKTADSEHIVCEFTDDWFSSRDTGAGESANAAGDPWQSLSCVTAADVHTNARESNVSTAGDGSSEFSADRKSKYVNHGVDATSEFSDSARDATDITLLELADASHNAPADADQNRAVLFPSSVFPADHQFTNELDSVNRAGDIFSEFGAVSYVASESTDPPQTLMMDADCKKVDDVDNTQCMQLFEPFPDSGEFHEQLNAGENDSVKQGNDTFSDFRAISYIGSENTNSTQTSVMDGSCKKVDDADNNQSMQFLFPDSDKFNEQLNTAGQLSTLVPITVRDQQLVEFSDEVLLEKHETNTSLPDVHSCAVNQELVSSEFPDQLISEETSTDVTAERAESPQPTADASDTIFIDEIQV